MSEPIFPSGWKASLRWWWNNPKDAAALSEKALVERGLAAASIPLVDAPEASTTSGKRAVFHDTQLDGHGNDPRWSIHSLEIGEAQRRPDEHAVVVGHGYGNGLGFLWQNMGAFASVPNTRVHFIDWLGMGRSGRPPFPSIKQKANTQAAMQERVTAAEAFFVDSLEEFRRKNNIEKMTLVGHSIGGYINSAYSIKYPERINRLVLISPAGVPKSPYRSNLKDDSDATPQEQKQTADAFAEEVMPASSAGAELPEAPKTWWSYLWEQGSLSPFSLLRASSFMAPSLMSRYANRRFSSFDADTQRDLFQYLYAITTASKSGEMCFSHFLAPGAHGRWPLIGRLPALSMPITFIYGDSDWMDSNAGREVVKLLKQKPASPETELQKKESKVLVNSNAGHWVFLESVPGFNRLITQELQEADRQFRSTSPAF